jgi:hypothetical protein
MNPQIQKTYELRSGKPGWLVYDADDTTSAMSAHIGYFKTEAEALAAVRELTGQQDGGPHG